MLVIQSRQLFLSIFLFVLFSIGFALYLQYFQGLQPCPLCMLQRVVFIILGLIALIAYMHNPMIYGFKKYGIASSLISLMGIALAGRHIYLENLPLSKVPACGPSIEVMLEYLPLFEVVKVAIMGTGECTKIAWNLFGFSIATLSILGFIAIFLASVIVVRKPVGRF